VSLENSIRKAYLQTKHILLNHNTFAVMALRWHRIEQTKSHFVKRRSNHIRWRPRFISRRV